jgi:hypothetical protein
MHIDFHSASGARAGKLYSFLAKAYRISHACLWRKADVSAVIKSRQMPLLELSFRRDA